MDLIEKAKIIFIDLDGTLLDQKKKGKHDISDANISAIKQLKSNGKQVIISTGRSLNRARKYLDLIDSKYAVIANGSQIVRNNKIIKEHIMGLREVLLIHEYAIKHKLLMKVNDENIAYGVTNIFKKIISKKFNLDPSFHYNIGLHGKFNKIVIWGKSKGKLKKIALEIKSNIENISIVSSSGGWTLEITDKNATKGLGNLEVANFLKINKSEDMVHIGDTMNDSTVVEHMNLIAMQNSTSELKNLTPHIGPNYKKGGVAKILLGEL